MTLWRPFKAAVGRFARDESGAIAYLLMVGLMTLILMVFLIVNTGNGLHDRTRAQDAADALALTHAVEGARSLNVMSMNNVGLTQAFAVGTISSALKGSLEDLRAKAKIAMAEIAAHGVVNCPLLAAKTKNPKAAIAVGILCAGYHTNMVRIAAQYDRQAGSMLRRYDPARGLNVANKTIRALNAMNKALVDRYPDAVRAAAMPVARAARMSDFYFDEPCVTGRAASCKGGRRRQGMDLPVERGARALGGILDPARLQFCEGLTLGTVETRTTYAKRGFARGTGPLARSFYADPYLRNDVNRRTGVGRLLTRYYTYFKKTEMMCAALSIGDLLNVPRYGKWGKCLKVDPVLANFLDPQKNSSNRFTLLADVLYAKFCDPTGLADRLTDGIPGLNNSLNPPVDPVLYHPKHAPDFLVTPFPSVDRMHRDYKPMAMTFRRQSKRWAPKILHEPMEGAISYAQSVIYNADGLNIYSQNWTARLMPATRMDDLGAVRQRMRQRAPSAFEEIRRRFYAVRDMQGWKTLNAR